MFIDIHAHIQDRILVERLGNVIKNAELVNVKKIICSSYDLSSSEEAIKISKEYQNVYATVGIHPENCEKYDSEVEKKLIELCNFNKVVAVGEIGLDYHYSKENKELQKQVFINQIIMANKLSLPIVIHSRDAIGDTMQIIREYKKYLNNGVIFHCFNESEEILKEILAMGFYVSFGGVVTFNNAKNLVDIVKKTPVDRIFTETDCPYLTPVPFRGQINEPKNINLIIKKISEIKNIDLKILEKSIENNVKKIFKI